MNWQEIPSLDETRCTGCEQCILVCPTDCLEIYGPVPWLPRPTACVGCGLCACICPVKALEMKLQELV